MKKYDVFSGRSRGMDDAIDSLQLNANQYEWASNIEVRDGYPTTRAGGAWRSLDIEGHLQGAIHYNPSNGFTQQNNEIDTDVIFAVYAGRKWVITPTDSCPELAEYSTEDVTGEYPMLDAERLLVVPFQAEKYVIVPHEGENTWIWSAGNPSSESPGRNSTEGNEELSKIPNNADQGIYAHSRILAIENGNKFSAGDPVFSKDVRDVVDILSFTEQEFASSGVNLSPPSNVGKVTAMGVIQTPNSLKGFGDIAIHTKNRKILTLNLSNPQRQTVTNIDTGAVIVPGWEYQPLLQHLVIDTAATGPFAITNAANDQIFRSHSGMESILTALGEDNRFGEPKRPFSEPAHGFFIDDGLLEFASVDRFQKRNRIYATVGHVKEGLHRGGRGLASYNLAPYPGDANTALWEGVQVLPEEVGIINQTIESEFGGRNRMFALTSKDDDVGIWEFSDNLHDDYIEGEKQRIPWKIVYRKINAESDLYRKSWGVSRINFENIIGEVDYRIMIRSSKNPCWSEWDVGRVCSLGGAGSKRVRLSEPPDEHAKADWIQMAIEGVGHVSPRRVIVDASEDKEEFGDESDDCDNNVGCCSLDPYKFSVFNTN